MDEAHLLDLDAHHVWHPYGAFPPTTAPLVVASASGVRLKLANGRELIDGMSSWWAAIHGYHHPHLDAAAHRQVDELSHVMFGGLTHEPAVTLAARLAAMAPGELDKVFLADSGSVSVEVAAKMAIQYQRSRGHAGRTKLATWRGGYHGDTLTPMSVCDPDGGMHAMWRAVLPAQVFADAPPREFDAAYATELRQMVQSHAHELAAVIVEPVVQGAGGMRFHDPAYLRELRRVCDETGVLLIFDEIATGFGRTGELFAADHAQVVPDIMCVGKALTGGYVTLAATLTTQDVAEVISRGEAGGLAHGPTFMGNPLACAIANASLDLVDGRQWRTQVPRICGWLEEGLAPARELPGVRDVRVLGAIGVIELERDVPMQVATDAVTEHGVWLRPFRNLIYTMPPYICTHDDIAAICRAAIAGVTSFSHGS
ncbi:adenosylmethionine--8-amino-7-oxononanoate transaminase [Corynebacterium sanguinis]|uniref:Adenosylmethionine-8-amino-7-oxononanoate aminotransferase n=1 Tax=Corynebacterium sanguinis TaxID=2594913 RepID=A0A6I7R7B1_9CORY|nr:adenosylmethionine--8-amino-7-oxononanoate transaminase [Corynebacterium sanguinis]MBA4503877.1 adenosylmethionine--8-amino-7-oxononanoate transaminase [Corynebacterium sanguinis]MCT1414092.1 adenosylmethionine--8-amino-7-oxononanoate transaminase [Corynebacterium sanguinis]MCT1464377.1 adenosylmethionine--8-amino-7-oxononanoate transaminase [Corynebacterium sanguinis]MCT1499220.1 adenosylmethionine--8-amino-7-oxononanoate transaminase [Corynebacterium sanguinis]MCT1584787.1 adenosylmethion